MNTIPQGRQPSPEREAAIKASAEYWLKTGNENTVQAMGRVEEAAKQLVALTGALQGLYFAIFAVSELRKQATGWLILPFFLPVALWLGSLYCATQVFVPKAHLDVNLDDSSPTGWLHVRDSFTTALMQKLTWLHWSHRFLLASFALVLGLLVVGQVLPAAPAAGPTQIIILTPTPVP